MERDFIKTANVPSCDIKHSIEGYSKINMKLFSWNEDPDYCRLAETKVSKYKGERILLMCVQTPD